MTTHPATNSVLNQADKRQTQRANAHPRHVQRTDASRPTPPARRELADTANQCVALAHQARREAQLRNELSLAYSDLGGAAFALAHQNSVDEPRLAGRVQRIYKLNAQLAALA